ncbi:hypothetical protein C8J57DRAFT_1713549 [Mycena rebaudengoi]|nr:hypothetical protein C8J57DRAFT_1713549 [Mycena rebaudengoi]
MGYEELEASGLRVSLFPGSPPLFVREQNFAIGILVARAEHSKLVETPPPSAQSMEERCRRAGLAYAGICHILAVVGNTRVPTMVSVCFIAAHASPYIAFGSSIAKKPGSSAKERLRRLRHDELQTAYPTIKFFAGLKKAPSPPSQLSSPGSEYATVAFPGAHNHPSLPNGATPEHKRVHEENEYHYPAPRPPHLARLSTSTASDSSDAPSLGSPSLLRPPHSLEQVCVLDAGEGGRR